MRTLGDDTQALSRAEEIALAQRELVASSGATHDTLVATATRWLPLLEGDRLVGLWASGAEAQGSSFFIRPAERGRGLGDWVVEELAQRGDDLLVCAEARGYFEERGYVPIETVGALVRLRAPTRVMSRPAASVCLFERDSGQVLIGQRLTPPWPGYWAFPGGKLEPGESPLTGALRELHEETGISLLGAPDVLLETRVYAGGSGTVYAIDNFCLRALELYPPELSLPELRPCWVPLQTAAVLRPMAAGTRRVIRKVRGMAR